MSHRSQSRKSKAQQLKSYWLHSHETDWISCIVRWQRHSCRKRHSYWSGKIRAMSRVSCRYVTAAAPRRTPPAHSNLCTDKSARHALNTRDRSADYRILHDASTVWLCQLDLESRRERRHCWACTREKSRCQRHQLQLRAQYACNFQSAARCVQPSSLSPALVKIPRRQFCKNQHRCRLKSGCGDDGWGEIKFAKKKKIEKIWWNAKRDGIEFPYRKCQNENEIYNRQRHTHHYSEAWQSLSQVELIPPIRYSYSFLHNFLILSIIFTATMSLSDHFPLWVRTLRFRVIRRFPSALLLLTRTLTLQRDIHCGVIPSANHILWNKLY